LTGRLWHVIIIVYSLESHKFGGRLIPVEEHSMVISSRTPEGEDNRCPLCGHALRLDPSRPPGDAPCPCCGVLLWFPAPVVERLQAPATENIRYKVGRTMNRIGARLRRAMQSVRRSA
jgi:hypothetical protein